MIAAESIHAALGGIGEDIFLESGLANFFGDIFFLGKWRASGLVFDEFDAKKETEAANFADVGMGSERRKRLSELVCGGLDTDKKVLIFEHIKNGISGGGGNRMGLIGEAVLESARAFRESICDAGRN